MSDYGALLAVLSSEDQNHLSYLTKLVAPSDLFDKQLDDYHVTIAYGVTSKDQQKLIDFAKSQDNKIGKVEVTAFDVFEPKDKDYDVLVVKIASAKLRQYHKKIEKTFDIISDYKGYRPHVTLAYLKKGKGAKYKELKLKQRLSLTVANVVYSDSNEQKTTISSLWRLPKSAVPVSIVQTIPDGTYSNLLKGAKDRVESLLGRSITYTRYHVGLSKLADGVKKTTVVLHGVYLNEREYNLYLGKLADKASYFFLDWDFDTWVMSYVGKYDSGNKTASLWRYPENTLPIDIASLVEASRAGDIDAAIKVANDDLKKVIQKDPRYSSVEVNPAGEWWIVQYRNLLLTQYQHKILMLSRGWTEGQADTFWKSRIGIVADVKTASLWRHPIKDIRIPVTINVAVDTTNSTATYHQVIEVALAKLESLLGRKVEYITSHWSGIPGRLDSNVVRVVFIDLIVTKQEFDLIVLHLAYDNNHSWEWWRDLYNTEKGEQPKTAGLWRSPSNFTIPVTVKVVILPDEVTKPFAQSYEEGRQVAINKIESLIGRNVSYTNVVIFDSYTLGSEAPGSAIALITGIELNQAEFTAIRDNLSPKSGIDRISLDFSWDQWLDRASRTRKDVKTASLWRRPYGQQEMAYPVEIYLPTEQATHLSVIFSKDFDDALGELYHIFGRNIEYGSVEGPSDDLTKTYGVAGFLIHDAYLTKSDFIHYISITSGLTLSHVTTLDLAYSAIVNSNKDRGRPVKASLWRNKEKSKTITIRLGHGTIYEIYKRSARSMEDISSSGGLLAFASAILNKAVGYDVPIVQSTVTPQGSVIFKVVFTLKDYVNFYTYVNNQFDYNPYSTEDFIEAYISLADTHNEDLSNTASLWRSVKFPTALMNIYVPFEAIEKAIGLDVSTETFSEDAINGAAAALRQVLGRSLSHQGAYIVNSPLFSGVRFIKASVTLEDYLTWRLFLNSISSDDYPYNEEDATRWWVQSRTTPKTALLWRPPTMYSQIPVNLPIWVGRKLSEKEASDYINSYFGRNVAYISVTWGGSNTTHVNGALITKQEYFHYLTDKTKTFMTVEGFEQIWKGIVERYQQRQVTGGLWRHNKSQQRGVVNLRVPARFTESQAINYVINFASAYGPTPTILKIVNPSHVPYGIAKVQLTFGQFYNWLKNHHDLYHFVSDDSIEVSWQLYQEAEKESDTPSQNTTTGSIVSTIKTARLWRGIAPAKELKKWRKIRIRLPKTITEDQFDSYIKSKLGRFLPNNSQPAFVDAFYYYVNVVISYEDFVKWINLHPDLYQGLRADELWARGARKVMATSSLWRSPKYPRVLVHIWVNATSSKRAAEIARHFFQAEPPLIREMGEDYYSVSVSSTYQQFVAWYGFGEIPRPAENGAVVSNLTSTEVDKMWKGFVHNHDSIQGLASKTATLWRPTVVTEDLIRKPEVYFDKYLLAKKPNGMSLVDWLKQCLGEPLVYDSIEYSIQSDFIIILNMVLNKKQFVALEHLKTASPPGTFTLDRSWEKELAKYRWSPNQKEGGLWRVPKQDPDSQQALVVLFVIAPDEGSIPQVFEEAVGQSLTPREPAIQTGDHHFIVKVLMTLIQFTRWYDPDNRNQGGPLMDQASIRSMWNRFLLRKQKKASLWRFVDKQLLLPIQIKYVTDPAEASVKLEQFFGRPFKLTEDNNYQFDYWAVFITPQEFISWLDAVEGIKQEYAEFQLAKFRNKSRQWLPPNHPFRKQSSRVANFWRPTKYSDAIPISITVEKKLVPSGNVEKWLRRLLKTTPVHSGISSTVVAGEPCYLISDLMLTKDQYVIITHKRYPYREKSSIEAVWYQLVDAVTNDNMDKEGSLWRRPKGKAILVKLYVAKVGKFKDMSKEDLVLYLSTLIKQPLIYSSITNVSNSSGITVYIVESCLLNKDQYIQIYVDTHQGVADVVTLDAERIWEVYNNGSIPDKLALGQQTIASLWRYPKSSAIITSTFIKGELVPEGEDVFEWMAKVIGSPPKCRQIKHNFKSDIYVIRDWECTLDQFIALNKVKYPGSSATVIKEMWENMLAAGLSRSASLWRSKVDLTQTVTIPIEVTSYDLLTNHCNTVEELLAKIYEGEAIPPYTKSAYLDDPFVNIYHLSMTVTRPQFYILQKFFGKGDIEVEWKWNQYVQDDQIKRASLWRPTEKDALQLVPVIIWVPGYTKEAATETAETFFGRSLDLSDRHSIVDSYRDSAGFNFYVPLTKDEFTRWKTVREHQSRGSVLDEWRDRVVDYLKYLQYPNVPDNNGITRVGGLWRADKVYTVRVGIESDKCWEDPSCIYTNVGAALGYKGDLLDTFVDRQLNQDHSSFNWGNKSGGGNYLHYTNLLLTDKEITKYKLVRSQSTTPTPLYIYDEPSSKFVYVEGVR